MLEDDVLDVTLTDRVGLLTLARPAKHNALNTELCDQLTDGLASLLADGARVVVLAGQGKSFCSGADLDGVYSQTFRDALYRMLASLVAAPVAVVAAVHGPAIGAGTQLAISADLRVCDDRARFAVPTARNGLAVDPWTVRRLALLAGNGPARRLLLAADTLSLEQAETAGLVDRRGDLDAALAWAAELATLAPLSVAYSKQALRTQLEPAVDEPSLQAGFDACWASEDLVEGRAARAEKRAPVFRGV